MIAMGLGPLAAHAGKFPCLRGLRLLNERLPRYFCSTQEESCIRTDSFVVSYTVHREGMFMWSSPRNRSWVVTEQVFYGHFVRSESHAHFRPYQRR